MADRSAPSTPTADRPARTSRARLLVYVLPFAVVIGAVAVIVPKVLDDDDGDESSPVFSSTSYEVTYEVIGSGTSDVVTFTSGAGNTETTLESVKLPWKKTMSLPVGVVGGSANLIAHNPSNDTKVTCRVSVAGVPKSEVEVTDGYVDPSCSVPLSALQGK